MPSMNCTINPPYLTVYISPISVTIETLRPLVSASSMYHLHRTLRTTQHLVEDLLSAFPSRRRVPPWCPPTSLLQKGLTTAALTTTTIRRHSWMLLRLSMRNQLVSFNVYPQSRPARRNRFPDGVLSIDNSVSRRWVLKIDSHSPPS